jgi:hypothetical protein
VVVEMDHGAVEVVRVERAARAGGVVVRAVHQVIDEQLRAPVEELRQGLRSVAGREAILLLDGHPRQLLALAGELVAATGQLLLALEQLLARDQPLLARPDPVLRHRGCLLRCAAVFQ